MTVPQDKLNCIEETQQKLGNLGRTRVFSLLASGELKSVKIGRRRFVPESEINAYIAGLERS